MSLTENTPISEFQSHKYSFFQSLKDLDIQDKIKFLTQYYETLQKLKTKYTEQQKYHTKAYQEILNFKINVIFQFESQKEKTRLVNKITYNKNRHHNEKEKYTKAINTINTQLKETHKILTNMMDAIKNVIPEAGPTCKICTDNIDTLLAAQCGHTLCQDCYKNLLQHNRQPLCPTCRKPIQKTLKLFI